MTEYLLSFKPAVGLYGNHDPSAALFRDQDLYYAVEEERFTREKHAPGTFPENAIYSCLDYAGIEINEIEKIVLPYKPELKNKTIITDLKHSVKPSHHPVKRGWDMILTLKDHGIYKFFPDRIVREKLSQFGEPLPEIVHREHHRCHAASAFYPSGFDEAVVLTLDGVGEYDSTVVWKGDKRGVTRVRTYEYPNSLGHFFGAVTEYLGYRAFNGEGKIMGLAPYGKKNNEIESVFRDAARFGLNYDVTGLLGTKSDADPAQIEQLFEIPARSTRSKFNQFHKDLAYTAQSLLEETVTEIIKTYVTEFGTGNVCLAGGVALNCKMNKKVMELDCVDELFVQPVAHDGGVALGAGWLEVGPKKIQPLENIYLGTEESEIEISDVLSRNKLPIKKIDKVERYVAEQLAEGALVGWMQGQMEMGPRALGNRSILADPRTSASRDQVNKYVKHREEWRPFAPSMLECAIEKYLVNPEPSPYMIKTFDTVPEVRGDIEAVVHPADQTTRPQTVRKDQNPRYYRLLSEFADITGVPVVLNTSFNDHGEPIVRTTNEAIKDFFGMGLDLVVLGDFIIEKTFNSDSKIS